MNAPNAEGVAVLSDHQRERPPYFHQRSLSRAGAGSGLISRFRGGALVDQGPHRGTQTARAVRGSISLDGIWQDIAWRVKS